MLKYSANPATIPAIILFDDLVNRFFVDGKFSISRSLRRQTNFPDFQIQLPDIPQLLLKVA